MNLDTERETSRTLEHPPHSPSKTGVNALVGGGSAKRTK
jgi:hypothetical protein